MPLPNFRFSTRRAAAPALPFVRALAAAVFLMAIDVSDCGATGRAVLLPRPSPSTPATLDPRALIDSHWAMMCEGVPSAVVQWTCTPFTSEQDAGRKIDARIQVRLEQKTLGVGCQVFRSFAQTDHARGISQATVMARVGGTGVGAFHVVVSCVGDDSHFASGSYSTTLVGTVTSH